MSEFVRHLLSDEYMSQGYCYLWQPNIVWLHVIADAVIAFVFFCVVVLLAHVMWRARQRGALFVLVLFGLLCGASHALSAVGVWSPYYYLSGLVKAGAGCAALAVLVMLVPLVPRLGRAIEFLSKDEEEDDEYDELADVVERGVRGA